MRSRRGALLTILLLAFVGCGRTGGEAPADADARVDPSLGSLKVENRAREPVAIYLEGQELYVVPSGQAFTFHNLPARQVDVYGVGRISQKHYGLPQLTIEAGGEYEWTINP